MQGVTCLLLSAHDQIQGEMDGLQKEPLTTQRASHCRVEAKTVSHLQTFQMANNSQINFQPKTKSRLLSGKHTPKTNKQNKTETDSQVQRAN